MEKRKDSKGRVLKENEIQRADGRYEYRYISIDGRRKSVYSWRLTELDPVPAGKKKKPSLRELEKNVVKDSLDGIVHNAKRTLNECWDSNLESRSLKLSTRNNYIYMYDLHVRNTIGQLPIKDITYTVLKSFYKNLVDNEGFKPVSVETYSTILGPVFKAAQRDGLIRLNPNEGIISELKKTCGWEKNIRHGLSKEQTKKFLAFVKNSRYAMWHPMFVCLFGTGCRIGEFIGLRWSDIHWNANYIDINHNLTYRTQPNKKMEFHITTTKTKNGNRKIPMLNPVKEALKQEYARQSEQGFCSTEIEGYSGFIWRSCNLRPYCPSGINEGLRNAAKDYNEEEKEKAKAEHRKPELLPRFSAHWCRHTFCMRLCENETDLKLIQEIMGHSNITTTMDIYNECNLERKIQSFKNLDRYGDVI